MRASNGAIALPQRLGLSNSGLSKMHIVAKPALFAPVPPPPSDPERLAALPVRPVRV
jgi:hypothetical protein